MHTTEAELGTLLEHAAQAAPLLAALTPPVRADLLLALADALDEERAPLVAIAQRETGLTETRLNGEVTRTIVQLRLFADETVAGAFLDPRIDAADPDYVLGARPDLRRTHLPLGPVLNFAASNFPFAFSVLGGDSASILAAGCPLIVKAHSGHPELSQATAAVAQRVIADRGLPHGTLQIIFGQDAGVAALRDSRIRAGAFTGSTHGGRILADVAASRPAPIPFYGELGSVNPVFITADAVEERADALGTGYVASVAGSAGQLCTKPGLLFVPAPVADRFITAVRAAADAPDAPLAEHRLLNQRVADTYEVAVQAAQAIDGVDPVIAGSFRRDENGQGWATPTLLRVPLAVLRSHREILADEVFGPFSLVIDVPEDTPLAPLVSEFIEGSLTGTLHLSADEAARPPADDDLHLLVDALATHSGRVLFDGWPTGVAVTPAQQHGGPWPATTLDTSTSVGTAALTRFLRPVAYQDAPPAFLPPELRDHTDAEQGGTTPARSAPGESLSWGTRAAAARSTR
ncbi:aldehyde dehydrogenase (NADP(+)) [Leucobacter tardus]|uniref:Aldehyde dehydrogenase family protein n=1 Tax=Leucobacter tardus TaxID=501483 RepID=A0A939QHB9_9MICO|nr:aldehyde dehydrogenase family protein [Leucobacter tardus]MBO2990098.1 aldehyde dehydrogenase family protein [Leucobacter tardus]